MNYYESKNWVPITFKSLNGMPFCRQIVTDEHSILITLDFDNRLVKFYFNGLSYLTSRTIKYHTDIVETVTTLSSVTNNNWMFKTSKSNYIDWFEQECPITNKDISHYLIITSTVIIEVLSTLECKFLE